MKRYDHTDEGMDWEPDGEYVRYEVVAARIAELEVAREMFAKQWAVADRALVRRDVRITELEAALAGAKREADDWYKLHLAEHAMYLDLGRILGADVPTELIVEVAHRRMGRIAELEAAIDKLARCPGIFQAYADFKALVEVRNKTLHK